MGYEVFVKVPSGVSQNLKNQYGQSPSVILHNMGKIGTLDVNEGYVCVSH